MALELHSSTPKYNISGGDPNDSTIPVVRHVVTDIDLGIVQEITQKPVNLNKVSKLLSDPHSCALYERHIRALGKVTGGYSDGFVMRDLVVVFKILNVLADRVEDHSFYMDPLVKIIRLVGKPFLKEKSSDEILYKQIAVESVSQLGYLLRVPEKDVRCTICESLLSIYGNSTVDIKSETLKKTSCEYIRKVIEDSDVSEILVKSLELVEDDAETNLAIIKVIQEFSKNSVKNVSEMVKARVAERLCSRFNDSSASPDSLFRSVEILWNLLEIGDPVEVTEQLRNNLCISNLRDAFEKQLTFGKVKHDFQLRNEFLVIASMMLERNCDMLFIETGFAKLLCLLSSFQEVKSHHPTVKQLRLKTNHEDFELKKIVMHLMLLLSRDSYALPILSENRVILALFTYLSVKDTPSDLPQWSEAQWEELQLHSLVTLSSLCPLLLNDYLDCHGSTRLLVFLEWCTTSGDGFSGKGNSFYGKGGRGNKRAQMRYCLRLVRAMVLTGDKRVLTSFVDQGLIHQLTNILKSVTKSKYEDDAIDIEMQTDMLITIAAITENEAHCKELFDTEGVDVLIAYLKMDLNLVSSGLGHHKLFLAVIDCIWCSVASCYMNEEYFMEKSGLFLLLDFLETCPKAMQKSLLGCLVDLAENSRSISYFLGWKGKESGETFAHLLCTIWEDKEIGVNVDENGFYLDDVFPLAGSVQHQSYYAYPEILQKEGPFSHKNASPAIVDISENMRANIYAISTKMDLEEQPGLTARDRLTLKFITNYLCLKEGEIWHEISNELELEGIFPIEQDVEALENLLRIGTDNFTLSSNGQKMIMNDLERTFEEEEKEMYNKLWHDQKQKKSNVNKWNQFVDRTSNYEALKAAKLKMEKSIQASRVTSQNLQGTTMHNMELSNLKTTAMSRRFQFVDSTPEDIVGSRLQQYEHVMSQVEQESSASPIED